jgi:ADP-heptose:LPS heptosyltransferase
MRDPDGAIQHGLSACGMPRVQTFPGLPDATWPRHATEYYAECLGVTPDESFKLQIPPNGPSLDVIIHPGSGSPNKNWPIENFAEVAAQLQRGYRRVTWCLGPAEVERVRLPKLIGDPLYCESLVELAGRLATARLYIGNDSGITHLAATLGVPTIAIFGPTDPAVWAPRGDHVYVEKMSVGPDRIITLATIVERKARKRA